MGQFKQQMRLPLALVLVLMLAFTQSAYAEEGNEGLQGNKSQLSGYAGPDRDIKTGPGAGKDSGASKTKGTNELDRSKIFPAVWCVDVADKQTAQTCWNAYRAGLEYYEWGIAHRKRVLWWQHMSTRAIFFVVLFLVGAGIYFAWVQFRAAPTSGATSELEISMQGVKVSSPILGVIILTLSLVFFYLYLVYVYPVNEVI